MPSPEKLNQDFRKYIQQPPLQWDLMEGALLIARQEYPDLNPQPYLSRVREMAGEVSRRMASCRSREEKLEKLNGFFFSEMGFGPNREDYYDPRNSYLPDLLD